MRILTFFILSSIVLSGCTMGKSSSPTTDGTQTPTTSYTETIATASSKIKNTPEFEQCMKPNVDMCINMVGNQLAQAQKSTDFCEELTQAESKESCKYGVIMAQTLDQNNVALCDTLNDVYKRECRIAYLANDATNSGDVAKCDALKNEIVVVSGESPVPFDRTEQCKADIIMRKTDAKASDCQILSSPMKEMCVNMVESRADITDTSEN